MARTALKNVSVRMGHHVINTLENVTVLKVGREKHVMKVSQLLYTLKITIFINL